MKNNQEEINGDITAAKLSLFKRYLNEIIIIALSSVVIFLFLKLMTASDEIKIYISKDQTELIKTNINNTIAIEKNTAQMETLKMIMIKSQIAIDNKIEKLNEIIYNAMEIERKKEKTLRLQKEQPPKETDYNFQEIIREHK